MLKRSRKLRFLKWAGLVGCVVLVIAWISNLWWQYFLFAWGVVLWSGRGMIGVCFFSPGPFGLRFQLDPSSEMHWLPIVRVNNFSEKFALLVPDWMLLSVLLPVTIWLWRRDLRRPAKVILSYARRIGNVMVLVACMSLAIASLCIYGPSTTQSISLYHLRSDRDGELWDFMAVRHEFYISAFQGKLEMWLRARELFSGAPIIL